MENTENKKPSISVILPAKNEAKNLKKLLPRLLEIVKEAEIIVVNDGSTDDTEDICKQYGVTVITHPYAIGNGAAIKTGARTAKGNKLVFMDADGQHNPKDIPKLLSKLDEGFDLVVGARQSDTHASLIRRIGNKFYNWFATIMTGKQILDLTSGFRAARSRHFKKFIYLLPNGFSYPTTSTMAFFRSGFPVAYVPIKANKRLGKSKINLLKDGARFLLIIIKISVLFSPMRLFLPLSTALFFTGFLYYIYTYITSSRFTNMSALLFTTSITIFLIGIISEQISSLHYKGVQEDQRTINRN